jgi:DNA-binding transcriptional ArsR family regulator
MYRAYKGAMTAPNRRMLWLLARAQRRVAAASDVNLADLELTSTQAGALFCFKDEGLLIGELAAALDLAQSAASGLATRLEAASLVTRAGREGRWPRGAPSPDARRQAQARRSRPPRHLRQCRSSARIH